MKSVTFNVTFTTPAFLGNSAQSGQWRTPPFKALLRHWWRIAAARNVNFDIRRLREDEGKLFGAANDSGGGSQRSNVRLRLSRWDEGALRTWGNDPIVQHEQVQKTKGQVGSHLYLGYGPLRPGTVLKGNAAIQADEAADLRVTWPEEESELANALKLVHCFGTIGGRSRNGWGSFSLVDSSTAGLPGVDQIAAVAATVSLPFEQCLCRDWASAIGADSRLLIWQSRDSFRDWRSAMKALAQAKIAFRTKLFPLTKSGSFEKLHLLAYPVTHHKVEAWDKTARLANQLRFKVIPTAHDQLRALIFHVPCALPGSMAKALGVAAPDPDLQRQVWESVHQFLDKTGESGFQRI